MTYTGAVHPGGPADVRRLPGLTVSKVSVGPMDNNAYLLRCPHTGQQVLIDAANDAPRLLELIGADGLSAVVTTHAHRDHWAALAEVLKATGARALAHPADAPAIDAPIEPVTAGDSVAVGRARLEVIHLVGHTPGSIALLYHDPAPAGTAHVWTGDSLFPGGVGKTHSPQQFASLIDDVQRRLFDRLPDDTWFYPGHGADSTLGQQRPHLAHWRARGW